MKQNRRKKLTAKDIFTAYFYILLTEASRRRNGNKRRCKKRWSEMFKKTHVIIYVKIAQYFWIHRIVSRTKNVVVVFVVIVVQVIPGPPYTPHLQPRCAYFASSPLFVFRFHPSRYFIANNSVKQCFSYPLDQSQIKRTFTKNGTN